MGFFEQLNQFDSNLLLRLNDNFTDYWDAVMYLGTDKFYWIPMFATFLFFIVKNKGRESILIVAMLVIALLLDDSVSTLLKNSIARLRPSHDPSLMYDIHTVNAYRGGLYGFVSSHAANSFGLAIFLSLLIRNHFFTGVVFLWATFHSYTRIYLGVHYPFDILGGAVLGSTFGYLCFSAYLFLIKRFHFLKAVHADHNKMNYTPSGFNRSNVAMMALVIIFSFLYLLLSSKSVLDFMS